MKHLVDAAVVLVLFAAAMTYAIPSHALDAKDYMPSAHWGEGAYVVDGSGPARPLGIVPIPPPPPPKASLLEMVCEHPNSHKQVRLSVDASDRKIRLTDPDGQSADFPFKDTLKNPWNDHIVHIAFGPTTERFPRLPDYFLDFEKHPPGFAARFMGGLTSPPPWTTYCIVPGRIVR